MNGGLIDWVSNYWLIDWHTHIPWCCSPVSTHQCSAALSDSAPIHNRTSLDSCNARRQPTRTDVCVATTLADSSRCPSLRRSPTRRTWTMSWSRRCWRHCCGTIWSRWLYSLMTSVTSVALGNDRQGQPSRWGTTPKNKRRAPMLTARNNILQQ